MSSASKKKKGVNKKATKSVAKRKVSPSPKSKTSGKPSPSPKKSTKMNRTNGRVAAAAARYSNNVNKTKPKTKPKSPISPSPMKKFKTTRKGSTIDEAISKLSKTIADQTKLIGQLKGENVKLKKEVQQWKSKKQEVKTIYVRPKTKPNPPVKSLPSVQKKHATTSGVITSISKDDAKNALSGLFGGAKSTKPKATSGVITSISKDDAKNALSGLLAPRAIKKAKSAMTLPGNHDDDDSTTNLSIRTPLRLVKYEKLCRMMPTHVVENRMKMDGVPKLLMAQLTKQWLPATVPDGIKCVDRQVAPPPPLPKAFRHLIESKTDDDDDRNEEHYQMLKDLGLKPKKKIIPSQKMKRFHWKKIDPQHIPSTLWMGMDETSVLYNKIEFELKFAFRTTKPNALKKVKSIQDRTGQVYTFVLPKRSQNVQIALSRFKYTDCEFKAAVIGMNEEIFTIDILETFIDIAPNEEEQREAETHANKDDVDPKYFGRSERFFFAFIDMVDLSQRLELWLFMMNFKEIVSDKQSQIYKISTGCKALKQCESFHNILRLLLAWGNHMNGGSHAGQAFGFEMESLQLLPMIKTMDNQMNMMMYLYKTMYEKYPKYLDVMTDLKAIKVCATMESEMLDRNVNDIKLRFDSLRSTLLRFEEDYLDVLSDEDAFVKTTKTFIKNNNGLLKKLLMSHKRTKDKCEQLGQMFGYNLTEHRIEGLFSVCNTFIMDLYKARDDLHKLEIEREKKRKKLQRKAKKEAAAKHKASKPQMAQAEEVQKAKDKLKKRRSKLQNKYQKAKESKQNRKRSILDDIHNRKRKNTIMLQKVGPKIAAALMEKSKVIEANNFRRDLPETVKQNKVKRKVSNVYTRNVRKLKPVSSARMRLPSISDAEEASTKNDGANKKAKKKRKRGAHKKRKQTGWFTKGQEPKIAIIQNKAYDPRNKYNYKMAHERGRGISNHKEGTVLTGLSKEDMKKAHNMAKQISNKHHKKAQSEPHLSKSKIKTDKKGIMRLDEVDQKRRNSKRNQDKTNNELHEERSWD
eukprot:37207_1